MILAADVGGTNARLGFPEPAGDRLLLVAGKAFPGRVADVSRIEDRNGHAVDRRRAGPGRGST
jgi:hypothetical protein